MKHLIKKGICVSYSINMNFSHIFNKTDCHGITYGPNLGKSNRVLSILDSLTSLFSYHINHIHVAMLGYFLNIDTKRINITTYIPAQNTTQAPLPYRIAIILGCVYVHIIIPMTRVP